MRTVYFASMLNTTLAALDRIIIDGLSPKPVALSLGDPPVVDETKQALRSIANDKAIGPDELPAELLKLGLSDSPHKILLAFHGILVTVWMTGEVLYRRSGKTPPSKMYTRRRIGHRVWQLQGPLSGGACWQGSPQNRGQSTWRLLQGSWDSSRGTVRFPERSTTGMMSVVHRLPELGRQATLH